MIWLANNWRLVLFGVVLLACVSLAGMASHYRGEVVEADMRAASAETIAQQRQETINDMQVRQSDVAALDAKYTGELADAKATIDELQRDVADGRKRLRVNATCSTKNDTASPSGVDDASSAELTQDARQNYFRLREQLATSEKQILGLQDYIRKVVFDEKGESNQ